ncbi:MAG TPA: UbiA prenyltransferase family protein [Sunxiuqinia sp.]|nr:UbiA prenyltransferase family protein [Sunxiuqinia sp.]
MIKAILKLVKPTHYIKNLFVLLPLFFSTQFTNTSMLENALLAFFAFCLMASSVYIFNDIHDAEEDRNHPQKKNRPIASGAVSPAVAYLLDLIFTIASLAIAWTVNIQLIWILLIYKGINILYTLIIKRLAILDVMTLSLGFVLRLYAGSVSTGVVLSEWIIIMTFLLSLLIVLGKRRNDVIYFEEKEVLLRKVVKGYNSTFLNYTMIMLSSIIVVAYLMYTLAPLTTERFGTNYLFVTVFWVVAGILRYLQLLFVEKTDLAPVSLLIKDHPLKLILLIWFLNFLYFIYLI